MSSRIIIPLSLAFLLLLAGIIWILRPVPPPESPVAPPIRVSDADLPDVCRKMTFENVRSIICEIDLQSHYVELSRADAAGKAYGSLQAFLDMQPQDARPVLAMNAGMYEQDLSPVGLYVEDGREVKGLRMDEGTGNFFLKPNGVFFVGRNGAPGILETGAFAAALPDVRLATQSGPMLVIGGQLHPRFEPNGASQFIRNGIGLRNDHKLMLAISMEPVSFGSFARLFRDGLGCADALYFDGTISALSNDRKTLIGGVDLVGPIIAIHRAPVE